MLGLSRYTQRNLSKSFNVSRVTSCTLRLSNGGLTIKMLSFLEYRSSALSLSFKFFWFFASISFFWSCSTIILRSLDTSVCNSCICDVFGLFFTHDTIGHILCVGWFHSPVNNNSENRSSIQLFWSIKDKKTLSFDKLMRKTACVVSFYRRRNIKVKKKKEIEQPLCMKTVLYWGREQMKECLTIIKIYLIISINKWKHKHKGFNWEEIEQFGNFDGRSNCQVKIPRRLRDFFWKQFHFCSNVFVYFIWLHLVLYLALKMSRFYFFLLNCLLLNSKTKLTSPLYELMINIFALIYYWCSYWICTICSPHSRRFLWHQ